MQDKEESLPTGGELRGAVQGPPVGPGWHHVHGHCGQYLPERFIQQWAGRVPSELGDPSAPPPHTRAYGTHKIGDREAQSGHSFCPHISCLPVRGRQWREFHLWEKCCEAVTYRNLAVWQVMTEGD